MNACATGCGAPAGDRALCPHHADELWHALDSIPDLVADLEGALTRGAGGSRVGGRSSDKPLPYDPAVSGALSAIRVALVGWTRVLAASPDQYPEDTIAEIARWLLARHEALVVHEAAADIHAEIVEAARMGRRAQDRPPHRIYLGPCSTDGCTQGVWMTLTAPGAVCRACGARHTLHDRVEAAHAALSASSMTAAQLGKLAALLHPNIAAIKARDLVYRWAARDTLTADGIDEFGRPTYPAGPTLDRLIAAYRPGTTEEAS